MKSLGLVFDDRFKRHLTGPGHPERPERIDAVRDALHACGVLRSATRIESVPIDLDLLHRLHTPEYVERARSACESGQRFLDVADSAICPSSYEIALLAAGGVVEAARAIARGELRRAFCAVRPPGHHAERDLSMGFCLFGNVALAAETLRSEFGLERILILDWDVHHGNGTQHLFETSPDVLFVSLHGHPDTLYPGTGYEYETGRGAGTGFTLNVPMRPRSDDDAYRRAFDERIEPAVSAFRPQITLVSAGFDAHRDDPVGNQSLEVESYEWMTRRVIEWAERHGEGRVLSVLEGGYDLAALRQSVEIHVRALAEDC